MQRDVFKHLSGSQNWLENLVPSPRQFFPTGFSSSSIPVPVVLSAFTPN